MQKKHRWAISRPVYFLQRAELMAPGEWPSLQQYERVFKDWNPFKWLFFYNTSTPSPQPRLPSIHTHTQTTTHAHTHANLCPTRDVHIQSVHKHNGILICPLDILFAEYGPERRLLDQRAHSGYWAQRWERRRITSLTLLLTSLVSGISVFLGSGVWGNYSFENCTHCYWLLSKSVSLNSQKKGT